LLGNINIISPASVHFSEHPLLDSTNHSHTWSHDHVDDHSVNHKVSNISVPAWLVIIVVGVEEVPKQLTLLSKVGVGHHDDESCVQEQRVKYVVGDVSHLLGFGFVTNSLNKSDGDFLKDHVDDNDSERDGLSGCVSNVVVRFPLAADSVFGSAIAVDVVLLI